MSAQVLDLRAMRARAPLLFPTTLPQPMAVAPLPTGAMLAASSTRGVALSGEGSVLIFDIDKVRNTPTQPRKGEGHAELKTRKGL